MPPEKTFKQQKTGWLTANRRNLRSARRTTITYCQFAFNSVVCCRKQLSAWHFGGFAQRVCWAQILSPIATGWQRQGSGRL